MQEDDGQDGSAEAVGDQDAADVNVEAKFEVPKIGLGREVGRVQLFEGLGDALDLGGGKPRCSSFLTMPFVLITSVCIRASLRSSCPCPVMARIMSSAQMPTADIPAVKPNPYVIARSLQA
jgi:hypothetical protein